MPKFRYNFMHIASIQDVMYISFEHDTVLDGDSLFQFVNENFAKPQGMQAFIGGYTQTTFGKGIYDYRVELMLIEK